MNLLFPVARCFNESSCSQSNSGSGSGFGAGRTRRRQRWSFRAHHSRLMNLPVVDLLQPPGGAQVRAHQGVRLAACGDIHALEADEFCAGPSFGFVSPTCQPMRCGATLTGGALGLQPAFSGSLRTCPSGINLESAFGTESAPVAMFRTGLAYGHAPNRASGEGWIGLGPSKVDKASGVHKVGRS